MKYIEAIIGSFGVGGLISFFIIMISLFKLGDDFALVLLENWLLLFLFSSLMSYPLVNKILQYGGRDG